MEEREVVVIKVSVWAGSGFANIHYKVGVDTRGTVLWLIGNHNLEVRPTSISADEERIMVEKANEWIEEHTPRIAGPTIVVRNRYSTY